jgi:mannose-6-phosphate isomerase class I
LGAVVAERFASRLPYLFKVLSAAVPLSIQAHPTKQKAAAGFARENAAQIPLTARHRNYKDDNHKPEILAALTDFYALRGFRRLDEIARLPADVPELRDVMSDYQPTPAGLKKLYEKLMTFSPEQTDAVLRPLVTRLATADRDQHYVPADREYWVLAADRQFSRDGHHDPGLFSIYLLNLVHLRPGEAVYLPAGVLHAYLRGSGMELMANSNNVLRGGLTPKHVDVPELLANVVFDGGRADVIRPVPAPDGSEQAYPTPAPEFELRRIEVTADRPWSGRAEFGPEIIILVQADDSAGVSLDSPAEPLPLKPGDVCFAPCGADYACQATAPATLFRATVPESG